MPTLAELRPGDTVRYFEVRGWLVEGTVVCRVPAGIAPARRVSGVSVLNPELDWAYLHQVSPGPFRIQANLLKTRSQDSVILVSPPTYSTYRQWRLHWPRDCDLQRQTSDGQSVGEIVDGLPSPVENAAAGLR